MQVKCKNLRTVHREYPAKCIAENGVNSNMNSNAQVHKLDKRFWRVYSEDRDKTNTFTEWHGEWSMKPF